MPGTIQVSVLDFKSLRSSSALSQLSIKVSLGKREYETWDTGDFSFPLTTLRDNLIVKLQDAEGNEISHTGVETRLVIEKGTWDDTFPLEGGGQVHMKLQFLLSEEDRHRIRLMRESALRKKNNEVNNGVTSPHYSSAAGSETATTQASQISNSPAFFENLGSGQDYKEGNLVQKQADRYNDSSFTSHISKRFEAHPNKVSSSLGDKSGTTASSTEGPLRMIRRKEALQMGNAGSNIAVKGKIPVKMKEVGVGDQEKRRRLSRDQINVRSMISVFETSKNQEAKVRSPQKPIKSQTNRTAVEVAQVSPRLGEIKMGKNKPAPLSGGSEYPFVKELSGVTTQDMAKLYGTRAAEFQTKGTKSDLKDKLKVTHEVGTVQEKRVSEDLLRASMGRRASISGRGFNKHPGTHPHSNLHDRKQSSPRNSVINSGRATDLKSSQGASGDEHYSSETNRGWIYPVQGKSFCITTAGKQIMNIMGGFWGETKVQSPEASSSGAENLKESAPYGSPGDIKEHEGVNSSQRLRKSEAKGPRDAEKSRGPVGQVMRVAIMVGFATLVLFTRQKRAD